jgi:hypothetical protein
MKLTRITELRHRVFHDLVCDRTRAGIADLSMEMVLLTLLPKMVGNSPFDVYSRQGKVDLRSERLQRFRGYARCRPDSWIVVMVDREDTDCAMSKADLAKVAQDANLATRSNRRLITHSRFLGQPRCFRGSGCGV